MKDFVLRINNEFTKSLPTNILPRNQSESQDNDDLEIEELLLEGNRQTQQQETTECGSQELIPITNVERKVTPKKSPTNEKITTTRNIERPLPQQASVKTEKLVDFKPAATPSDGSEKTTKDYMDVDSSALYTEDEDQMDDEGNIFNEEISEEIYDIMEIENEATDNIYLDESGKQVIGDDDSEFILVNFKSSNEDLTEKEQYVVEELYDDDASDSKPASSRKKHVNRMPREIIDKYAQSTENNQHICTKCVKVFSTRTNLIRHIQSHDGYKAYRCDICNKGFTQSGSLKQHKYIHSGERPYKCEFCDRAFTQGKTLKFHLRRHTEEKPFICTQCNSAFRQRDGLKRHLKSRHNIELKYERHNQLNTKLIELAVEIDEGENKEAAEKVEANKD